MILEHALILAGDQGWSSDQKTTRMAQCQIRTLQTLRQPALLGRCSRCFWLYRKDRNLAFHLCRSGCGFCIIRLSYPCSKCARLLNEVQLSHAKDLFKCMRTVRP